jgi:hypothetical protein
MTMSKAEYTLLAVVIGFYALLFAYLLTRACAATLRALWPAARKVATVSPTLRERNSRTSKAWTRAVWRGALATETEQGKRAAAMTA